MADYDLMKKQLEALISDTEWEISVLANASALIWDGLEDLELGPFQGKPACVRIEAGKGVCGTSVAEDRTQLVADVHAFPGHIACDSASNSEIVVPVHVRGEIYGVLDIDSPLKNRFAEDDREGLEMMVRILEKRLETLAC